MRVSLIINSCGLVKLSPQHINDLYGNSGERFKKINLTGIFNKIHIIHLVFLNCLLRGYFPNPLRFKRFYKSLLILNYSYSRSNYSGENFVSQFKAWGETITRTLKPKSLSAAEIFSPNLYKWCCPRATIVSFRFKLVTSQASVNL